MADAHPPSQPPSEAAPAHPGAPPVAVHGLLVCRRIETTPEGEITLHNVVEVIPVDQFPADVGPLVFVALVRNLPAGPGKAAFALSPVGRPQKVLARLPMDVDVHAQYRGRQVALQLRVPSIPVASGGWFEVRFEWDGRPLASNRFIVGARSASAPGA
jgi:hypothetical protein